MVPSAARRRHESRSRAVLHGESAGGGQIRQPLWDLMLTPDSGHHSPSTFLPEIIPLQPGGWISGHRRQARLTNSSHHIPGDLPMLSSPPQSPPKHGDPHTTASRTSSPGHSLVPAERSSATNTDSQDCSGRWQPYLVVVGEVCFAVAGRPPTGFFLELSPAEVCWENSENQQEKLQVLRDRFST